MKKIQSSSIRLLANECAFATEFFSYLSGLKRHGFELTVERLLRVIKVADKPGVIRLFKAMELSGLGTYFVGRRGAKSRFEWAEVNVAEVCQAFSGEIEEIDVAGDTDDSSFEIDELDWVPHRFQLRPGLEITVNLPEDLTQAETTRLAKWLTSLPFEVND